MKMQIYVPTQNIYTDGTVKIISVADVEEAKTILLNTIFKYSRVVNESSVTGCVMLADGSIEKTTYQVLEFITEKYDEILKELRTGLGSKICDVLNSGYIRVIVGSLLIRDILSSDCKYPKLEYFKDCYEITEHIYAELNNYPKLNFCKEFVDKTKFSREDYDELRNELEEMYKDRDTSDIVLDALRERNYEAFDFYFPLLYMCDN